MSLAFRFKAGGSEGKNTMGPVFTHQHHHRSTTKNDHKAFKSKHATKSALKDKAKGKVEREDRGQRRTVYQQVMSKLDRRNKAKQLRVRHKEGQDRQSAIFHGVSGAAKHIAVVPLSTTIDVRSVIGRFTESVDISTISQENGLIRVTVDRFKRNLLYIPTSFDLLKALDVCKLADWIVFLVQADQEFGEVEDTFLRALEGQGITEVSFAVTDIEEKFPANKRSKQLSDIKQVFTRYFASLGKVTTIESKSDCANLVRSFCTASSKGIRWRDVRSWMLIDEVRWEQQGGASADTCPILTGTIRGNGLNPDRLVHIPSWGEYRIKRIVEARPQVHKRKANEMATDDEPRTWIPSVAQDDLAELAPEEEEADMSDTIPQSTTVQQKGVLLDDHHYFSDDESTVAPHTLKLPEGTSKYQAAWYLDDISDSDSDILEDGIDDDVAMDDTELGPEDGLMQNNADAMTDAGGTEYPESEMHIDVDDDEEARQLEEFRASRKKEAEDDLEYPDEIELLPDVLARERLAKYRGLKSLRTSEWNTAEDKAHEPQDYQRLLQVPDYKKSYTSAIKETLATGIPVGTRVSVELEHVPASYQTRPAPTSLFSLLRHEHKQAVVNLNLTLASDVAEPIKSKEELIVQIGHRRLAINPVFSAAGQTPNDVHKFDRFLHPGRSAIATFTGPLTWGSVPVLVFRRTRSKDLDDGNESPDPASFDSSLDSSQLELIGTATTVPPSSSRVIAKRIILTGHPFKIHKKLVTVRYMFFNREDVVWFSALPLWTKRGRQGFVKEPLGTHGYFKATFDGVGRVNAMDAIGVSLYKRVWPRACRRVE